MKKTDVGVVLNIAATGTKESPKLLADVMFENQTLNGIDCKDNFFVIGNTVRYRVDKPSEGLRLTERLSDSEKIIIEEIYNKLVAKMGILNESIERRINNIVNMNPSRARKELDGIAKDKERIVKQQERLNNLRSSLDNAQIINL